MRGDYKFCHKLRVRFAETDMQGIVFNGNYLTYYDVAWTEYFREMGFDYKTLVAETGVDTVLAKTTIEFKAPCRFDEILEIYVRVSKIGNTSLTFEFEIQVEGEDRLVSRASSLYVCIDPETLRPVPVPDRLRAIVQEFEKQ